MWVVHIPDSLARGGEECDPKSRAVRPDDDVCAAGQLQLLGERAIAGIEDLEALAAEPILDLSTVDELSVLRVLATEVDALRIGRLTRPPAPAGSAGRRVDGRQSRSQLP